LINASAFPKGYREVLVAFAGQFEEISMPFKSIAVFVDATPSGEARICFAARLACAHGSHLIGIFVVPPILNGSPAESFVQGRQAVRDVIIALKAREAAAIDAAKQMFSRLCGREDVSFEFRPVHSGDFDDTVALNSLHTDLVIAGSPRGGGLPSDWPAEAILLATGVPFLLLPESWSGTAVEHVVVAWNASREARRAISDALPFLIGARSVTILLVDPEKNPRHGEEPGADVAHYLSRHGASVAVEQVASHGEPIAKVMLDYAKNHHTDLIVVGAYSHGRAAQLVFGGVTRSLLKDAALPLLIAH
jgi:nucleotide-binding universal stress UspA family protein